MTDLPPFLQQAMQQPPQSDTPQGAPPEENNKEMLDLINKAIPPAPDKTQEEIAAEEKEKKKATKKATKKVATKKEDSPASAEETATETPPKKKRGRPKKKSTKDAEPSACEKHEPGTRISVARHYYGGEVIKEAQDSGMIKVLPFSKDAPPAYVEVTGHFTKNQGNYESAKFGVSIKLPAYVEELPEAYKAAYSMMVEALTDQRQRLEEV